MMVAAARSGNRWDYWSGGIANDPGPMGEFWPVSLGATDFSVVHQQQDLGAAQEKENVGYVTTVL